MKNVSSLCGVLLFVFLPQMSRASSPTPDVEVRLETCACRTCIHEVQVFVDGQCSLLDDQAIQRMFTNAAFEQRRACNDVPMNIRTELYTKASLQGAEQKTRLAEAFFMFKTSADPRSSAKLDPTEVPTQESYRNLFRPELDQGATAITMIKRAGAREGISAAKLATNPFLVEGKLLAISGVFERMLSRNEAVFSGYQKEFVVTGAPSTKFRDQTRFLIVGRGQGQGKHGLPLVAFVDAVESRTSSEFAVREAWLKRRNCQLASVAQESEQRAEVQEYKRAMAAQTGNALARFRDNQDGTVTDTKSGLTWMRNSVYLSGQAYGNKRAREACASSNFAGQAGWRWPKRAEWETLVDASGVRLTDTADGQLFGQLSTQHVWIPGDLDPVESFHNRPEMESIQPLNRGVCLDERNPAQTNQWLGWTPEGPRTPRSQEGFVWGCGGRYTCVRGQPLGQEVTDGLGATAGDSNASAATTASGDGGPSAAAVLTPYAGRWVGQIKWGLASSVAVVTLTGTTAGGTAGTTQYTKDRESSPYCEGTLIASESVDGQHVFQEQIVRTRGLECPGGGNLRISMPDGATADAAWDNRHKPGKVSYRGTLKKQ